MRALCPTIQSLTKKTIHMTLHPTKESALSSVLNPSTDFRYKKGSNHGLGKVFIKYHAMAALFPTGMSYPSAKAKIR